MTKTYAELKQQIESLRTQAEAVLKKEKAGVAARIREAIAIYELTAADLGFDPRSGKAATPDAQPARRGRKAGAKRAKSSAKYSDGQGRTWTGMGPKPRWFKDAVAAGHSPESMLSEGANGNDSGGDSSGGTSVMPDAAPAKRRGRKAGTKPANPAKSKSGLAMKYRDDAGHAWSGRGPKPRWFKDAIASGKTPEQLAA